MNTPEAISAGKLAEMSRYETLAPTLQQLVWQMTRRDPAALKTGPNPTVAKARREATTGRNGQPPGPGGLSRQGPLLTTMVTHFLDLHRQLEDQMARVVHMQHQIDRIVATLRQQR